MLFPQTGQHIPWPVMYSSCLDRRTDNDCQQQGVVICNDTLNMFSKSLEIIKWLWATGYSLSARYLNCYLQLCLLGVITPNQIPLTPIVTYLQKCYRSRLYLHAVWYLPFTNSPRKHTVTYHFSDLQEVYSGNRQIHTKCQLQYLHPPHISTSGKCHCVIIHQATKAIEYIGYMSKYMHKSPLSHICTNRSLRSIHSV